MRQTSRTILVVMLAILWIVAPPLAAASDACMAMSGVCEGPCGAASCSTIIRGPAAILPITADIVAQAPDEFPSAPLRILDLPPRPRLLLA